MSAGVAVMPYLPISSGSWIIWMSAAMDRVGHRADRVGVAGIRSVAVGGDHRLRAARKPVRRRVDLT